MATSLRPFDGQLDTPAPSTGLRPFDGTLDDEQPKAGVGGRLKDAGLALAKGVVGVPEAAVGLADIVTGGGVGKALENEGGTFGFRPKQAKDYLSSLQSDAYKAEQQQFSEAEGIGGKALAALQNPALVANTVVESAPSMLGGAALARGAGMAVPALAGRLGLTAAGEGAVMAGSQAEQIRQQTEDGLLTPKQAALSAATGLVGGAAGALGSRAARALGVGDIDQMIASGAIKGSARQGIGIANRGARGALTEGVFEELPQSLAETGLQNIALDRPVTQGMEESAVMGTLAGGVMGAGAGVVSGLGQKPPGVTEQEWQTILGAGDPDAIRPEVPPVEAPDLTTAPGAAEPRTGMDFTRDVDTSGLGLQDPAEVERARAQTMDFQRQDMTPDWETSQGAGVPREGLTMPTRQIDTSGLSLTPSEAMGIDPSAGPLSRAAASAVDSGAMQALQQAAAPQLEMNERPDGTLMVTGDFNAIRSQLVESGIPAQSIIRNMRGATVGRTQAKAARQALSTQQEAANVSTPAPVQRNTDTSAGTGSAQPETGVPAGVGSSERGTGLAAPDAELATSSDGSGRPVAAAAVDSPSLTTNVQNQPQGTSRAETQAAPVEARAPARGDAAAAAGVPAATGAGDVQADGLKQLADKAKAAQAETRRVGESSSDMDELLRVSEAEDAANERLSGALEAIQDDRFGVQAKTSDGRQIILTPSAQNLGQWQLTRFARDGAPWGDSQYTSKKSAILDFLREVDIGTLDAGDLSKNQPNLNTSAEPVQKTAKTEQVAKAPAEPVKPEPPVKKIDRAASLRKAEWKKNPLRSFLGQHGLSMDLAKEFAPGITERRKAMVGGYGPIFRKSGKNIDLLAEIAREEGFISADQDATDLYELIAAVFRGERVAPMFTADAAQDEMQARMAAMQEDAAAGFDDFLAEQQAMGDPLASLAADDYTLSDIDGSGFADASPELKAEVAALSAQLETMGVDVEGIAERVAQQTQDKTANEYHEAIKQALQSAYAETTATKPGGLRNPGEDGRSQTGSVAGQDGLTAPTRKDIEAQQARTEQADKLDERAQVKRESEAVNTSFMTGFSGDGRQDTTGDIFAAQPERFEAGKSLTKEQRREVLKSLVDVYKQKGADRELKGVDQNGNERYGYVHSPELFEKSDITGSMVRYYVTMPDGRTAHPSELFPDLSVGDVERIALEQEAESKKSTAYEKALKPFYEDYDDAALRAEKSQLVISKDDRFAIIPSSTGAVSQARSNGWEIAKPAQPKAEKPQDAQLDAATVDATDATYPPASQAHQKAATAFAERLSKNRDSFVLMDAVKPSGARAKEAQSVSDLAKTMFGREVVFVKFKGRPLFNGAVSTTDQGKVFVNIESARPMMAVLGHELLHELRKSNQAAYNQLAKTLKTVTKDDYIYEALLKQKYRDQGLNWTPQDISEELYGDIVGDNFMDPKFWEAIAGDKPIFAKQLYRAVMNWLDKIASMFKRVKVRPDGRMVMTLAEQADGSRPFGTQKYLQDIEAARAAVAQAMGQFKQGGKGKDALSVSGEPSDALSIAGAAGKGIDRIRQAANAAAGKNVPRAATMGDLDAEQKAFLSKTGSSKTPSTDVIKAATDRAGLKIRQGVIDRYAALKELDEKALGQDFIGNAITDSSWVLAKMSSAGSGALNAMMTTGRLEFDDKQKVIGLKGDANGGLTATLKKLGGPDEVERFFGWIAANRAEKLLGEGRENLFTPDEIKAAKRLNEGKTEEGKSRALLYTQAFKEFQEYRDDVLAIAEKSGIISDETRALWRDEFYVPFYRVMQDDGKTGGPGGGKGLSRQEAFKKLKGGSENLNDLMENTLMNFHHLLSASLKNQAASQAIRNAEKVGIANPVPESRRDTDKSTFVLKNGQKVYYEIDDPLVFESITSLSDPGLNNFAVRTMSAFKRVFTNLTTVTPQFVIANTFRDLLQASATSPTSKNVALNAAQGLKTYRDQKTRAEMLASGGAFSFGHIYGMDPDEVKASLRKTVKGADLISDPSMIPGILRKGWKHWNDAIDTSENISRAATYAQNVEGLGKLRAAFEARDVMDFSQHGAWPAVRLLVRVVPFLNARLQGLDKLYRSGVKPSILTAMGKGTDTDKQAAARFATVAGALAVATMALYMVNADDEEYQKLEEWQKDTYWFFRIGDNAFFLPKPFEVGAIATLAERTLQQFMDDKATGKLFGERVKEMLMQTFAFNPVPQMFQPIVDVYANRDAFTGRDIETMGMERLSPGLRARDTTTAVGRGLSAATRVFGDESAIAVSPVQADHLIKGYLGGVGASSAGILDTMYRAATGQEAPDKRLSEYQPIRRFYRDLGAPAPNSRYSTLFYDGLREANRVYADVMELQKLGKTEEAQELRTEKQNVLRMRQQLNAQQRRLSDINQRMQTVRRADKDGEWKRREIDMLNTQKSLITERMGKMIEIVRAE